MPFDRVPTELAFFCRATISGETARRLTEGAGAALTAAQTQELERVEQEAPEPPPGPPLQQLSVDGAMVPLVGGEWAEVKTLALGRVGQRVTKEGETVAHATELSYFSRLAEAQTFRRLALVATHRAGTETAARVCAVTDAAEWTQGFVDFHRPGTRLRVSIRILDPAQRAPAHAAEHVSQAAHAVFGAESPAAIAWLDQQLTELKSGDPDQVLAALATLSEHPDASSAARDVCQEQIAYLTKRREQIAYATFRAAGYPIGDGIVRVPSGQDANKLVVEARLKGSRVPSGCRWERENVNPMVALRACACSDQWEDGWAAITTGLREQERVRRHQRHQERQLAPEPQAAPPPSPPPTSPDPPSCPPREKLVVNGRPQPNHPWRKFRLRGSPDFPAAAKS